MRLASSANDFDGVWHAFLSFWQIDRVSLLVSVGAVAVSLWVGFISRRSTKAAERSAKAAEQQAQAAHNQAREATWRAVYAADVSEIGALETARNRIDRNAPSAVVAIDYIHKAPLLVETCSRLPVPHPEPGQSGKLELPYEDYWHYDVYILLRGTIYNDGDRAIRVYADVADFYAGPHPLTDEEVPVPQYDAEGFHYLYPGQMARFQVLARKQVDDWLQLTEERDAVKYPLAWFHLDPGGANEPHVTVKIKTETRPVKRRIDEDGDKIILEPRCYVRVTTETVRKYPTSVDWLHAELKNDQDKLHELRMREWSRLFEDRRMYKSESG